MRNDVARAGALMTRHAFGRRMLSDSNAWIDTILTRDALVLLVLCLNVIMLYLDFILAVSTFYYLVFLT